MATENQEIITREEVQNSENELKAPKKGKKVGKIIVNVVTAIIIVFVMILSVSAILSAGKGYTVIFGKTFLTVQSESMVGDNPDSFNKGDVITVKVLTTEEKKQLQVGDVITFWDTIEGHRQLNSHRIVAVYQPEEGTDDILYFYTKGDANENRDSSRRVSTDVVGKFEGKIGGVGNVIIWLQTKTGFFVGVILPTLAILTYCLIDVVLNFKDYNKKKLTALKAEALEQAKAELLREQLEQQNKENNDKHE